MSLRCWCVRLPRARHSVGLGRRHCRRRARVGSRRHRLCHGFAAGAIHPAPRRGRHSPFARVLADERHEPLVCVSMRAVSQHTAARGGGHPSRALGS